MNYIQGGVVNRGLKCFFSMYKFSSLIEAYSSPRKYRLMYVVVLAVYLFNYNFIFLTSRLTEGEE
jgi:hypothetical protein